MMDISAKMGGATNLTQATKTQFSNQAPSGVVLQLQERMSGIEITSANDGSNPPPRGAEELFKQILEMSPKNSKEIVEIISNMRGADGKPYFKSIDEQMIALGYSMDELNKSGTNPELSQICNQATIQLFGVNYFVNEIKNEIFFPDKSRD